MLSHCYTKTGSASNQFVLPLATGTTNLSIDWGDGTSEVVTTSGNKTHTYSSSGIYTIKVYGEFVGLYFNNSGDKLKITSIEQWGSVVWKSFNAAFYGCSNLVANYTDSPTFNPTNTSIQNVFRDCTLFNGNVDWLVNSSITIIASALQNCVNFNQPVNSWNTSNVTNAAYVFYKCANFNQPMSNWDTSKFTTIYAILNGCSVFNQSLNNWNTISLTTIAYAFEDCFALNQSFNNWNVSNVTNMQFTFAKCSSLNQPFNNWNTSSVINMQAMFFNALVLNQNLGTFNISQTTNMSDFCRGAGLSSANIDSILNGFAAQAPNIKNNISIRLGSATRTSASNAAVTTLTGAPYNWTITNP